MDGSAFDRLARAFVGAGTRRRLLSLLTALPFVTQLAVRGDETSARGRKAQRRHSQRQHRHTKTQRRKDQRDDTHAEACIPTGKRCPAKKPRGKKGNKLNCQQCCQRHVETTASGQQRCTCQPTGQGCRETRECCSGFCDGGACQHPTCGPACTGATPICHNHACVPCSANAPCPSGQLCLADDSCQPCTVTCPGGTCNGFALQTALFGGGTIYACPGRYTLNFTIFQDATLIGAGDGADPGANTILDAAGNGTVVRIPFATVALQNLRITGGSSVGGGGISNAGTLSLTACTVTGNNLGGGIFNSGQLTLTDCAVTANTSSVGAGIRQSSGQPVTLHNTVVQDNHAVPSFPGGSSRGGGIYIIGGTVAITDNSVVTGNTAVTDGGGIFNNGTVTCNAGGRVGGNTVGGNPNNCVDNLGMGCNTCPV